MSDSTSTEHLTSTGVERHSSADEEHSTAPATPPPLVDQGGVYREGDAPAAPGTVTVRAASPGHLSDGELVELVLASVPANVQVVVECAGRTLHPNIVTTIAPTTEPSTEQSTSGGHP